MPLELTPIEAFRFPLLSGNVANKPLLNDLSLCFLQLASSWRATWVSAGGRGRTCRMHTPLLMTSHRSSSHSQTTC